MVTVLLTGVVLLASCRYVHVFYSGHGPDSTLFTKEYFTDGTHRFVPLTAKIPCPAEDSTAREVREHWMDHAYAIDDSIEHEKDEFVIVWDFREDCPWKGGLTRQLVIGEYVFARHLSYIGWSKETYGTDQQYRIAIHELQHQLGLRHCEDDTEFTRPCIPPYTPDGQIVTALDE